MPSLIAKWPQPTFTIMIIGNCCSAPPQSCDHNSGTWQPVHIYNRLQCLQSCDHDLWYCLPVSSKKCHYFHTIQSVPSRHLYIHAISNMNHDAIQSILSFNEKHSSHGQRSIKFYPFIYIRAYRNVQATQEKLDLTLTDSLETADSFFVH